MVVSEVHLHGAADRGMHGDLLAVSVNEYVPDKLDLDQLPPDYMSLLALMFGLLAYLLVTPVFSWMSLLCWLSSLANMSYTLFDFRQIVCATTCVCLGLYANYFNDFSIFCS
mmetsp:Transcript_18362/g.29880  ORF Transcript_18362/g.29880 Transcript_18362/m.29880 type:complete len:112 (+) Transcript_18362:513-848(+)